MATIAAPLIAGVAVTELGLGGSLGNRASALSGSSSSFIGGREAVHSLAAATRLPEQRRRSQACVNCRSAFGETERSEADTSTQTAAAPSGSLERRAFLGSLLGGGLVLLAGDSPAAAVQQALLAGRIPGLSDPDENGWRKYRRPDGKSGGHGVGWSEMIPYSFNVTESWGEIPVSIADLGGTEIDLRFTSKDEGNISVVVAPCLRFSDRIKDNAKIEDVGTPDKVIMAFGPEITGQNVEGLVKDMAVKEFKGRTYYQYELNTPHMLVSATAAGNRLYIMTASASGRQWKKYEQNLRDIVSSFRVG